MMAQDFLFYGDVSSPRSNALNFMSRERLAKDILNFKGKYYGITTQNVG